ncbi:MAG: hypothetical protein M0038_04485 [Pseudomonadota bacterium]|jgi:hypothetical protein|nr:hypothetical protein [Pseudomonadota bacterium]
MGGNQRERQRRLQKKRLQKKRQKRAARRSSLAPLDGEENFFGSLRSFAAAIDTNVGIEVCCTLLAGGPPVDTLGRKDLAESMARAGGAWERLPFELSDFFHRDAPWSLTASELAPLRRTFESHGALEAFERLWALALTLEPDPLAALAAVRGQSCAHRATLAYGRLRACLDDSARERKSAVDAVAQEIQQHRGRGGVKSAYKKLLLAAVKSVHATESSRAREVAKLLGEIESVFERHAAANSHTAWWECGRAFLEEVLERHAQAGLGTLIARQPAAVGHVLGFARAAVWLARQGGSSNALATTPFRTRDAADACLQLLSSLDVRELGFEIRLRYEISRLKILCWRARSMKGEPAGTAVRAFLAAFGQVWQLLAHGVPPAHRELPQLLQPALLDLYIETIDTLDAEGPALEATRSLFEENRGDFRLACLVATGALARGQRDGLAPLKEQVGSAHVDPELFARHAFAWIHGPGGSKSAERLRAVLFDPLDREQRKQCLLKLAQEAVRRARSRHDYEDELRSLLPYFDRTNFISRELREGATLESELVFFASMMAPVQGARLALNESQSQQWVSCAREIGRRSAVGAEIVTHHLLNPSPWIGIATAVRHEACAQLEDFRPPVASSATRMES